MQQQKNTDHLWELLILHGVDGLPLRLLEAGQGVLVRLAPGDHGLPKRKEIKTSAPRFVEHTIESR